ncbi:MAG TPA: DUF1361 domain-containing protein [Chloroflexota bacterium]|nr:DUF1361 domain-containing protein [Chloroflexota bacterium]
MRFLSTPFGWVTWNLFLAAVPVGLAHLLCWAGRRSQKRPLYAPLAWLAGLLWIVFLPNTCYLLTEWRHFLGMLDSRDMYVLSQFNRGITAKLMIYTVFYFCYSGAGMLAFALAIRPVHRLFRELGATVWVYGAALFLLVSLGVYLGLVPRFNSWNLVNRPDQIWQTIAHVAHRPKLSAFMVAFAGVLWIGYAVIDIWFDGLILRYGRLLCHEGQIDSGKLGS